MQINTKTYYIYCIILFLLLNGCGGCSKSGRLKNRHNPEFITNNKRNLGGQKNIIKMEKVNGVFQIPVEVNGVKMYFIFDTGASTISISETEAIFLYKQGSLSQKDILGNVNFTDANGDISEGTIIVLRSVTIGSRVLENIEASVVHNLNAPLLFGQSALGKFGKISIDNNKNEITFE
jgi:aspartyl protease family protein